MLSKGTVVKDLKTFTSALQILHTPLCSPVWRGEQCSERTLMKKIFQGVSEANDKLDDNFIGVLTQPPSLSYRPVLPSFLRF